MQKQCSAPRGDKEAAAVFTPYLRPQEQVLFAVEAAALWELAPVPSRPQRIAELSHAALVSSEGKRDVALIGFLRGWFSEGVEKAIPIGAGEEVSACEVDTSFPDRNGSTATLFLVGVNTEEICRALNHEIACVLKSGSLYAQGKSQIPSPSGRFNWLWSYRVPNSLLPCSQPGKMLEPSITWDGPPPAHRLLMVSMNCAGSHANPSELVQLFGSVAEDCPAIIAVSLQEQCDLKLAFFPNADVERASMMWQNHLGAALREALRTSINGRRAPEYCSFGEPVCLVGLLLLIWIRSDLQQEMHSFCKGSVSLGNFGLGNKGCIAASFCLQQLKLCFMVSHLPSGSGPDKQAEREKDVDTQLQQLACGESKLNIFEHDVVLWGGDFNSKPGCGAQGLGAPNQWHLADFYSSNDELTNLRERKPGPLRMFQEARVSFAPTYKMVKQHEDIFDTSREPGWTDRILWWSRENCVECASRRYDRIKSVTFADHRPVALSLDIWTGPRKPPVNIEAKTNRNGGYARPNIVPPLTFSDKRPESSELDGRNGNELLTRNNAHAKKVNRLNLEMKRQLSPNRQAANSRSQDPRVLAPLSPNTGARRTDAATSINGNQQVQCSIPQVAQGNLETPPVKKLPKTKLKLLVFDFDQTLSQIHVFKELSGGSPEPILSEPFAYSERGQVQRIVELDLNAEFADHGGFARFAFGGDIRVRELQDFLVNAAEERVEMVICTKGLVGTIHKCLEDLKLRSYFSQVYGYIGNYYRRLTDYDEVVAEHLDERESRLLGIEANKLEVNKAQMIQDLMEKRNLKYEEVCFIDDDRDEINRASGCCRTLHVDPPCGMSKSHFEALLRMIVE